MILGFLASFNLSLTPPDQNLSISFFATPKLWYHLFTNKLFILGYHYQTLNKTMKNQVKT